MCNNISFTAQFNFIYCHKPPSWLSLSSSISETSGSKSDIRETKSSCVRNVSTVEPVLLWLWLGNTALSPLRNDLGWTQIPPNWGPVALLKQLWLKQECSSRALLEPLSESLRFFLGKIFTGRHGVLQRKQGLHVFSIWPNPLNTCLQLTLLQANSAHPHSLWRGMASYRTLHRLHFDTLFLAGTFRHQTLSHVPHAYWRSSCVNWPWSASSLHALLFLTICHPSSSDLLIFLMVGKSAVSAKLTVARRSPLWWFISLSASS